MGLWGRGAIIQRQLAADGQVWVVHSSLGLFMYRTQTQELIGQIKDVANYQISPDGQRLAVADLAQQINLYRLEDGQKLLSLGSPWTSPGLEEPSEPPPGEQTPQPQGIENGSDQAGTQLPGPFEGTLAEAFQSGITGLRFSTDGARLAVGYSQPAILVWNLATGRVEYQLQHAIMPAANRLEFSPDGKYLANNAHGGILGLWLLAEERLVWRTANGGQLTQASFLPDGRRLLTHGLQKDQLLLWDLNSGGLHQTFQATNLVEYLNFSQDGGSLFFLTRRPQSGRYLIEQRAVHDGKLETFAEFPASHAIAPDRLSLAGFGEDGQLLQFNLRSWELTTSSVSVRFPDGKLVFSFSGRVLAAVSPLSINLWDYPQYEPLEEVTFELPQFNLHLSSLMGVQTLQDDRLLAYGMDAGSLFVWDVFNGQIERFDLLESALNTPSLSPNGEYLAVCTSEGLRLFSLKNSETRLMDRCKLPGLLLFSKDSTLLARASGLQIDMLGLPDGVRHQYLAGNTLEITSMSFSPDSSFFTSGTGPERGGAESVVWNFSRPLSPMRLSVPSFGVESLAFSGDNQYLATGGGDDKIRLWRVADGWLLRVRALEGSASSPKGSASSLTFSPNNQIIAVGLSSGDLKLLSIPDGEQLAVLEGHAGRITGLAFSSDGSALYSSSADGTVRLWGIPAAASGE